MTYKTFNTERLSIKPTLVEDAAFILEILNTPKFIKYVADRNVRTVLEAQTYIEERMLPQLKRLGFSSYTVTRKSDNQKIGVCGLYDREGFEGIDIGFSFLPQYERQGYAYESSSCLLNAAFNEFKVSKVSAITVKNNFSSQKLIERLGLTYKGIINLPNDPEDLLWYQLKKST